jgi:hypothetical protein
MTGYSETPLVKKLGIKAGANIALINEPDNYDDLINDWPVGVSISRELSEPTFDFIHYFVGEQGKLAVDFPTLKEHLDRKGMLWISWPKKVSGQQTDLDENLVRELGLAAGLVDVKVAAVDETWSALKFVYRVKDR